MSSLSPTEIQDFLDRKDRWAAFTTIGPDGFPHSVPMGYFRNGDTLVLGCRDGTQKVKNLERNPNCSLLWENGRDADEMIAVMFQGTARVIRDDEARWALKAEACRQRGEAIPKNLAPGAVYIVLNPTRTLSWRIPRRGR